MSHGQFSGEPKTDWLTEDGKEDRRMTVLEDFWFRDPDMKRWEAPVRSVIDRVFDPASAVDGRRITLHRRLSARLHRPRRGVRPGTRRSDGPAHRGQDVLPRVSCRRMFGRASHSAVPRRQSRCRGI